MKCILVGNTLKGTHLELKSGVCTALDLLGLIQLTCSVLGTITGAKNTKKQMVPVFQRWSLAWGTLLIKIAVFSRRLLKTKSNRRKSMGY